MSAARKLTRLRRITDLFVTGKAVTIGEDENGPVRVWVNKLSAAERNECQRDGQFGAMRRKLALGDDSPEIQIVRDQLSLYSDDEVLAYVIGPQAPDMYNGAVNDVRSDPEWQDDLVLIDREALAEDGTELSKEEALALGKLHVKYQDAIEAAFQRRKQDALDDARGSREEMEDAFVEAYRENKAKDAFAEEYMRSLVFFSLRDCVGEQVGEGVSHERCVHHRLLEDRASVDDLPEEVLSVVNEAFNELTMTEAEAGNSAAPTNS